MNIEDTSIDLAIELSQEHTYIHHVPLPKLPENAIILNAGELLKALSAPVRISIILLLDIPRCVHELVEALNITQPLVSQHLRVLRSTGIVLSERRGREVLYKLSDDHLTHIVRDAVAHVQE